MARDPDRQMPFAGHLRPTPIVGYTDPMTAAPGDTVRVMVSCEDPSFRFDLVRLWHGDENPAGPGFVEEVVDCPEAGDRPGRVQPLPFGSHVEVPDHPALALEDGLTVHVWVLATTPAKGLQGLVTKWDRAAGWGLFVGEGGDAELRIGTARVATGRPLREGDWYLVSATYDARTGRARVEQRPRDPWPGDPSAGAADATLPAGPGRGGARLVLAGHDAGGGAVAAHFNGKLDAPRVYDRALIPSAIDAAARTSAEEAAVPGLVAAWDLALEPSGDRIVDVSPSRLHGRAVQMPARAVTGWNWTGEETDFRRAPREYGAIHFHDDDLVDAGWEPDVEIALPADLPSGVYAARLRSASGEDHVPFFVRPPRGVATADVALLMPTNSYLAYANLAASQPWADQGGPLVPTALEMALLSLYDVHSDGSGCCYSSRLRPNLKMRPKTRLKYPDVPGRWDGIPSYPHQFAADLHLVHWLRHEGRDVDVLTDELLDEEGLALLSRYRVVVSGTHPEYWSGAMLDALQAYLRSGGRFVYLGGNGFYWVTSFTADRSVVEVRRAAGTRAWETEPGEAHHSTTGEAGGLWRHRGRAPQALVGVGFTAQGYDGAAPYRRTEASRDPAVAWIFEGLPADHELIGDHASLVFPRGAAGFELDRADRALGTPEHAVVLASSSSEDYTASYQHAIEEVMTSDSNQGAPGQPLVRADLVLLRYPEGGAVFSTGSIAWCGALWDGGYGTDVARITGNVLRAFASEGELPSASA